MKILLDTHVWIWSQESPQIFGPIARQAIADENNGLFVSPISSLEIARQAWGGRLTFAVRLQTWIGDSMNALHADTVPLTHDVALAAYDLPGEFHRDPADRVLAATAMVNALTLVSADERILAYEHLLSLDARA